MLGIFSSKSEQHPLTDADESQRVLDALAAHEASAALDEIVGWLESIAKDEKLKLAERIALSFKLDEAAQIHARKLARDYLTSPRLGRTQEYKLWQANHDFWAQLSATYQACVDRWVSQEKGAEAIKTELPVLVARMMRAYSALIKWNQFRYGPVDGAVWKKMGTAFLMAEKGKFSKQSVVLYSTVPGETSVEQEYIKALVFMASSMDSLLPLEIEIAERFIGHFLPLFVFTAEVRKDNIYWVDATKPQPPSRLAVLPQLAPSLRFFSTGAALKKLEELQARVELSEVPPEVSLGAQYSPRVILPVLRHIGMYWAAKPPMRSFDRHRVKSRINVINSLETIATQLTQAQSAEPDAEKSEAWIVDDVSQGGMGAQVPLAANDWVRIGALLGIQPDGGNNWLLGVVRRFSRDTSELGSVGIETLSKTPLAVSADLRGMTCEAILLDALHTGETVRVILPSSTYESAIPLTFTLQGRLARLDPVEQIETGVDFDIGLYRTAPPG